MKPVQESGIMLFIIFFLFMLFGREFGDCICCLCLGISIYAAVSGSSTRKTRAAPSFLEDPVSIVCNDYWPHNFVDVLIPAAYKFWNQRTNIAAGNAFLLDGIMTAALAEAQGLMNKRTICSKGIVTCGTPTSGIGISNSSHTDGKMTSLMPKKRDFAIPNRRCIDASMCWESTDPLVHHDSEGHSWN
jgi:hypothetical protein